ncbi:MAG: hypothetical protein ACAH21_09490 [Ramlibacter sp.]|nr:hypothetical protein [Ramlibacter sp.]
MEPTERTQQDDLNDEPVAGETRDGQPPPTPDERGPHDVPDDKVIDKTLPATSR